ncbi:hypothetical protein [uncultured Oscillibacter sp.]|uniref:hypothetical protein n=1 Tax=uncultured Oscillibacter sp. TaxID=876091 RepID=UPI002622F7C9|nr:hypothetical protein [uncultured Oscillibacter sp.]
MKRLTERLENGVINVKYASQHETAIHRLVTIEDILGDEYDLGKLMELVQAKREGRIVLRSAGAGKKCGSCGHFHRIPGTKRGTCAIRRWERNRLGQTEPWRHSFTPSQSYGACREYVRGESSATE